MEFASLNDAFPSFKKNKPDSPSNEEGFQQGLPDPDRPAVQRMNPVPSLQNTGGQENFFQLKPSLADTMNALPKPKSVNALEKAKTAPKFFGAEPFTNPAEDTQSSFINHSDNPNAYMLDADFTQSFEQKGFGKSTNVALPTPELRHRWKPLSNGIETAFVETPNSSQFSGLDLNEMASMKSKLDSLMARLDDLEYRHAGTNPQMEMLAFIMTGLFIIFGLDLAVRKSSGMRLLNVR